MRVCASVVDGGNRGGTARGSALGIVECDGMGWDRVCPTGTYVVVEGGIGYSGGQKCDVGGLWMVGWLSP